MESNPSRVGEERFFEVPKRDSLLIEPDALRGSCDSEPGLSGSIVGKRAPAVPANEADCKRQEYWESFFRAGEDRWQYDNVYEKMKYEQTLGLLPPGPIGTTLELACAEGHFTARLASRVGGLIATDISATALERARTRCVNMANVEFRVLDLLSDGFPQSLDLLICSEVLYYVSLEQLAPIPEKFAAALNQGGHLLMAHACTIADERNRTGFDWGDRFGAKTIAGMFSACSSLALIKELRTELYCIQLFQRVGPGQARHSPPEIIKAAAADSLPAHVSGAVIWGGAVVTRAEAHAQGCAATVPILMYHSIAETGPPELGRFRVSPGMFREHLRLLRRHGYHSMTLGAWVRAIESGEKLPGRPVVITFDDGYRDFITEAAPLLEAADFPQHGQPRLLHRLLGDRQVGHVEAGHPDHRRVVALDESHEGRLVAAADGGHDARVVAASGGNRACDGHGAFRVAAPLLTLPRGSLRHHDAGRGKLAALLERR